MVGQAKTNRDKRHKEKGTLNRQSKCYHVLTCPQTIDLLSCVQKVVILIQAMTICDQCIMQECC